MKKPEYTSVYPIHFEYHGFYGENISTVIGLVSTAIRRVNTTQLEKNPYIDYTRTKIQEIGKYVKLDGRIAKIFGVILYFDCFVENNSLDKPGVIKFYSDVMKALAEQFRTTIHWSGAHFTYDRDTKKVTVLIDNEKEGEPKVDETEIKQDNNKASS